MEHKGKGMGIDVEENRIVEVTRKEWHASKDGEQQGRGM